MTQAAPTLTNAQLTAIIDARPPDMAKLTKAVLAKVRARISRPAVKALMAEARKCAEPPLDSQSEAKSPPQAVDTAFLI